MDKIKSFFTIADGTEISFQYQKTFSSLLYEYKPFLNVVDTKFMQVIVNCII